MKKIFILLCMVGMGLGLKAQQDAHYSQYMFNHLAINPAYAGSHDYISSNFIYRKQWLNIDGAPTTQSFSVHGPSTNLRHGFGLGFYNDQIGVTRTSTLNLSYAYRIPLSSTVRLSFGLHGTVENISNRFAGVRTGTSQNPNVDPAFQTDINLWRPNAGAGVFLNSDHFFMGISAPDLIENNLYENERNVTLQAMERRHYFLHAGMITGNDESALRFKPSLLVKYVQGVPLSADFNAQLLIRNTVWVGASYRTNDAITGMLGWQMYSWLSLGYAYDYTISELSNSTSGSHELMLGIDLNFKRMGMTSPRWF